MAGKQGDSQMEDDPCLLRLASRGAIQSQLLDERRRVDKKVSTLIMVYNAQLIRPNFGSLDFLEKFLRPGLDF